jgi:hypothetical protein
MRSEVRFLRVSTHPADHGRNNHQLVEPA